MRVCIITIAVHGIGGMQDHTRDLARGLVEAGHEVDIITAAESVHDEWRDGVHYHYIDAPAHQNDSVWVRKSYEEFVRLHALREFDIVHSESSCAVSLLKQGVHRSVPMVSVYHGAYLGLAWAGIRRMARARTLRGFLREGKGLYWLTFDQYLPHGNWWRFRAVEGIVPSRQEFRNTYLSCLLKPSRLHVVPNGIDASIFRPRPRDEMRRELELPPGPLLICAGRLSREKGMHHAVAALARLPEEVRLVIVGGGEQRDALVELTAALGVADRVLFAGPQSHETLAKYIAAADVFLFPTERREAAPLILPQAMACGVPVVASAIGGIPEVVEPGGENGILVPPGNVGALVSAVSRLLDDEELRQRIGDAARKRVLEAYTIEQMTAGTVAIYELALRRLRGGPVSAEHRPPAAA